METEKVVLKDDYGDDFILRADNGMFQIASESKLVMEVDSSGEQWLPKFPQDIDFRARDEIISGCRMTGRVFFEYEDHKGNSYMIHVGDER